MSESLYDRNSFIKFNSNGNDPLTDKLIGQLKLLPYISTYLIQKSDEFRPDKLAAKFYGDSALYWVVLEYNGLNFFTDIEPGLTIKVAEKTALNNLLLSSNVQVTEKSLYIK